MMRIRMLIPCLGFSLLALSWAIADQPPAPNKDYAALSQMIQKSVVGQLPKEFKTEKNWGETVPIPAEGLRRMNRRQTVQVGDHKELPQGQWRKTRGWLDDPARDVTIQVRDLKPAGNSSYHIALDADARIHVDTEVQQWQKGLLIVDLTALADVRVAIALDCDVALRLGKGFPPDVKVEPKVTNLKADLKDFNLRRGEARRQRLALAVEGEAATKLGHEFKGTLQDMLHAAEPKIAERINEAIARSLREGKGTFSAAALLKALSNKEKAQK
jgi:hypothetical protein